MDQKKENNSEIDLSKSFDASGRKFQEETRSPQCFFRPGTPKIIQWVIKYSGGLIKNEKQAFHVVLGFIVLVIIISFFLIFSGRGGRETIETFAPPADQLELP
jgi:predicted PurR-regulated permease PerM